MFWKIYSIGWLVLYWTHVHRPANAFAWVGMVVSALGFVALLGYAFRRGFFHRRFWQGVFWALLAWEVYGHLAGERNSFLVQAFTFLWLLPAFVGVFRYAYSSSQLWKCDVHTAQAGTAANQALVR